MVPLSFAYSNYIMTVQDVQAHGVPDQRVLSAVSLRREGLRDRRDDRRLRQTLSSQDKSEKMPLR